MQTKWLTSQQKKALEPISKSKVPFKCETLCVWTSATVWLTPSCESPFYQVLWLLQTARTLLVSGFRGEQTSVLDISEWLIVCLRVIKCKTEAMRKALIKTSISHPKWALALSPFGWIWPLNRTAWHRSQTTLLRVTQVIVNRKMVVWNSASSPVKHPSRDL